MRLRTIILFALILILSNNVNAIVGLASTQDINYNNVKFMDVLDWYNPMDYGCTYTGEKPVVIYLHSGTFFTNPGGENISPSAEPYVSLLNNCYAVASLRFNASNDVNALGQPYGSWMSISKAVQFFRLWDANFNIDENRIVLFGRSAGGWLMQRSAYGMDLNISADPNDQNKQQSRPDYVINNIASTDANLVTNSSVDGGAFFGLGNLGLVSSIDKNKFGMLPILDINGTLFPNRIPETLFVSASSATSPPCLTGLDPHDGCFMELGLAKIQAKKPTTQSAWLTSGVTDGASIVSWLDTVTGYNPSGTASSEVSLTYDDNFTGYSGGYRILNDFTTIQGWSVTTDGKLPSSVKAGHISNTSVNLDVNVLANGGNSAFWSTGFSDGNKTVNDFNGLNGRLKVLFYLDTNGVTRIDFRLGKNSANYMEWRTSAGLTQITEGVYVRGWNIASVDLNVCGGVCTGSMPNYNDLNYFSVQAVYGATQTDFNVIIDRLWVELPEGAFGGEWTTPTDTNIVYGVNMPFSDNNGLSMTDTNGLYQNPSRTAFLTMDQFPNLNLTSYDFNISVDVNQVDTNRGTKILFDYVNPLNYSSCYINDLNTTGREIGVEQVVNGVSSNQSVTTNFAYNTKQTYICEVVGSVVSIYQNGTKLTFGSDFDRIDGYFGLSSMGGWTNFQNYSVDLTLISSTPSDSEDAVFSTSLNSLSQVPGLLIIAGLILILIFGIYVLTNPNQSISLPTTTDNGVIIVVYVALAIIIILFTVIISSYAITIT